MSVENFDEIGQAFSAMMRVGFLIGTQTAAHNDGRERTRIADIKRATAAKFGVRAVDMHSHRRARSVARPRQVAMYLARELTPLSLPNIGRYFDRDHTTVIHAIKTIERLMADDVELAIRVLELKGQLTGGRQ